MLFDYRVKPGQGPTQIAADINDPETQKKYGYKLDHPVTWEQIVSTNFDIFMNAGDFGDATVGEFYDKNNPVYKNLNINPGDWLEIDASKPAVPENTPQTNDAFFDLRFSVFAFQESATLLGGTKTHQKATVIVFQNDKNIHTKNGNFMFTMTVDSYSATNSKGGGGLGGYFAVGTMSNVSSWDDPQDLMESASGGGVSVSVSKAWLSGAGGYSGAKTVGNTYNQPVNIRIGSFDYLIGLDAEALSSKLPGLSMEATSTTKVLKRGNNFNIGDSFQTSIANPSDSLSKVLKYDMKALERFDKIRDKK